MRKIFLFFAIALMFVAIVMSGCTKTGEASKLPKNKLRGMDCSVFGGAMIDESKTGYENCQKQGYNQFCMMHRVTVQEWYSGLNCRDGFQYKDTESGNLACTNNPESGDYNFCQSPLQVVDGQEQRSMSTNYRDELICCK